MSHRKSDLGIPCPRKICQSSASRRGSGSLLHAASRRPLRTPLARRVAAAACAAVQSTAPLFRRWRDRRQTAPATSPATRAAQAALIMQQMRSESKQLHFRTEELDADQEAKCQKLEIDLVHDPPAEPDERQKSDRSGVTSQRLSRPPFQLRDRF